MRNKRTGLLGIGCALVALGVLLTPVASTGGSVHRNSSGTDTPIAMPMGAASVMMSSAEGAPQSSPATPPTTVPAPIAPPQPNPMAVSPTTTPLTSTPPPVPATNSHPAPSTPLPKLPQDNGGDHDPDNNGGLNDGDGEA